MVKTMIKVLVSFLIFVGLLTAWNPMNANDFNTIVRPFFDQYCVACHGNEKAESELRLDRAPNLVFTDASAKSWWSEIVNVLNSHEMPPESESQPAPDDVAKVVDWITKKIAEAELSRKESAIVLRRLNRNEYKNTIRDLVGIDIDVSGFPLDPSADGFDNNGFALTMSPLLLDIYFDTANKIVDSVIVRGAQPESIRWRFEPESGDDDSNRVRYGENNAIVNGGNNAIEGIFKVLHHDGWDKNLNARDFVLPSAGTYKIRVRAGGHVPDRAAVVATAENILTARFEKQMKEDASREKWHRQQLEQDLEHFKSDRIYNYGPPRLRLTRDLGGQPLMLAEFDIDASKEAPKVYEFTAKFTTEKVGLTLEYAYEIPSVLENFWMQSHDDFARPTAYVDWFEIEGPIYDSWPPSSHKQLLGRLSDGGEFSAEDEVKLVREVLVSFMRRAFRRPIEAAEVDDKLAMYRSAREQSLDIYDAIKLPLVAILCSPHFLYICEPPDSSKTGPRNLTDHELATRLSYFLWSSMPDVELMKLASAGKLSDKATLKKQVDRMIHDRKSDAFVANFAGQWLGLRDVGTNPPAKDLYPHYDRHLETSMVRECEAFFREILHSDASVMNFVRSDFVVINERLARFYGIDGVLGDEFRKVAVDAGSHRGGIVTQAAIHTITSNGTRTSPVKRGTWIMKNLLGINPGLPVANAGDIAPKVPGIDKATVRQRLEIHRTLPQCARCHNKIDPLGFALENFDASGQWRDQEGFGYKGRIEKDDPVIDASSQLLDGTKIDGVAGLQAALMAREDLFLRCLASKLITYAIGRELGVADQPVVNAAAEHVRANHYTLKSLIEFIVQSDLFRKK
jgi:mono/diheme cytochrome c family protein